MLTRCPSCTTVFRVTADQLKAKQATVRCGKCRQVFNALDSLLDTPQPQPIQTVMAEKEFAVVEQGQETPGEELPFSEPVTIEAHEEDEWELASRPKPLLLLHEPEVSRPRVWPWALGALLLCLLLPWQAVLQFRNELVVLFPEAKPALQDICVLFGCELSLPHKADLLGIEASDLHPDPANKDRLLLSATLKNRAPFAQTYPHLELTLTDTGDRPLLRKVIMPGEYLAKGAVVSSGFATNGEIVVNLALDLSGISASGYRLYLFYP